MLLKKNAMNKNKSFSRVNLVHLYSNIKELISLVYVGNASMVSLIEISVSQNYFFEK